MAGSVLVEETQVRTYAVEELPSPIPSLVMQPTGLGLERIVQRNEVVLIDTCCLSTPGPGLPRRLYRCREELDISESELKGDIDFLVVITGLARKNEHMLTVPGVLDELRRYSSILDDRLEYHKRNIASKQFRKGRLILQRDSKTRKYHKIEAQEITNRDNLRLCADKVFELILLLEKRIIDVKDVNLLERVKLGTMDFYFKGYMSKSPSGIYADERLAVAAYELASQGKEVAVVSNDPHLKRIFASCFSKKGLFQVPHLGYVKLYGVDDKENKENIYTLRFDSTLLLG